jgi:iron-sulfur cluster assembly protein
MITITPKAAKQIRESAKQGHMEGLPLRIAATRQPDGSIHYGMGFDDSGRENDLKVQSEGIDVVIAPTSTDLLQGTTLDYVELEPGRVEFIFLNPNDPNYTPPTE